MAYGTKYSLAYDVLESPSRDLATYLLTFELDGYGGSLIPLRYGGASPVVAKIKNSQDSIIGIREKSLSIEILEDIDLSELQRAKPKQWKVTHSKTVGSTTTIDFKGWLVPTNSGTEYVDGKKYIRLEANDGLEFLKNTDFVNDDGKYYEGLTSIFEIVRLCLTKTGLGLNINTINNTYAVGNAQNDSDDALKQRYIDIDLYRGDNEPFVAYKVLEQILLSEKCRICQEDGEWWFEHVTEKRTGFVKARKYQSNGTFISGGTLNLRVAALHNSNLQPMAGGEISSIPSNKWVKLSHKLGKFKNRLLNKDLSSYATGSFTNWFKTHEVLDVSRVGDGTSSNLYGVKLGGYASRPKNSAFLYQNIVLGTGSTASQVLNRNIVFSGQAYTTDVENAFVRCYIEIITTDSGSGTFGLSDSGEWIRVSADILLKNSDVNNKSKKSPVSWDITSKKLSEIVFYNNRGQIVDWQNRLAQIGVRVSLGQGVVQLDPYEGETQNSHVIYKNISLGWVNADTNRNLKEINYKATQSDYAPNNESFDVSYGDYVDGSNLAALKYADGSLTKLWTSESDNSPKNFHTLGVVDVLDETGGTPKVYDGTIWGLIKYRHSVELAGFTNRGYIVGYSYDYASSMADVRIIEHQDTTGVTVKKTGVLSDGTEIDMIDDSPPSPVMGNGVGGGSTGSGGGGMTIFNWIQQVLSGVQGFTVDEDPVNVTWGNITADDSFDFGTVVRRNEKLLIGSGDTDLELGKNDSLTQVLGQFGIRNTNNFLGEFSVAGLTANRVATLPNRNIEVNKWADLSGVPTTFTPATHSHEIGDINNLGVLLDGKQPLNTGLTTLAGLSTNGIVRRSGTNNFIIGTNDPITLSGDATGTGTTSIAVTLANSGVTAGTYRSVTVNAKGLVTNGTNPTTIAGYGITDFNSNWDIRWNTKIGAYVSFGAAIEIAQNLTVNQDLYVYGKLFDTNLESGSASGKQVLRSTNTGFIWTTLDKTFISDFSSGVLGQVLTGLVAGSNTPITSSNTVLGAFQNLQAQATANKNSLSGTLNYIPKFSSTSSIGNSNISDDGSIINIGDVAFLQDIVEGRKINLNYPVHFGNSRMYNNTGEDGVNILVVDTNTLQLDVENVNVIGRLDISENLLSLAKKKYTTSDTWYASIDALYSELLITSSKTSFVGSVGVSVIEGINGANVTANNLWNFSVIPQVTYDATLSNQLVRLSQVQSLLSGGFSVSTTCKLAFNTDQSLSGAKTQGGYTTVTGDSILLFAQSTASQNGVYIFDGTNWARNTANDTDTEIRGKGHLITNGTFANAQFVNNNSSTITVGTTAITYAQWSGSELDPIFTAHAAFNVTNTKISNWDTAFGWGNHTSLYVDKVSTQSDIAGAKKFTTSIQSPVVKGGTDSLGISIFNYFGTAPRIGSSSTMDFFATTDYTWYTTGDFGRMRLTASGLRVGSSSAPSFTLQVSGTTGLGGLLSVVSPFDGTYSSGTDGQFLKRKSVSGLNYNQWASLAVADISDIATTYQAKITGTENYLTKKTASNFGDSQIFDNGTFLAIGGTTAIDSSKFSVIGKIGATTARIGDDTDGINIGSLAINSTGSLNYGATSHAWNVSSTEKLNLNGSRLALTGDFELTGKLKVGDSFGTENQVLQSNGTVQNWATLTCVSISDIDTLYASKTYADANYVKRITDEGERGFYLYGSEANDTKEGFIFSNPDTGILGIHAYRLNGSTVEQYGFQLDKDGLPYWQFADGTRKRMLTELDSAGGGGNNGIIYTLADPLYFSGTQINIKNASSTQTGVITSTKFNDFEAKLGQGSTVNTFLNFADNKNLYFGYEDEFTHGARISHNASDATFYLGTQNLDIFMYAYGTGKNITLASSQGYIKFDANRFLFRKGATTDIEIDMSGFATGKVLKATSSTKAEWVTP